MAKVITPWLDVFSCVYLLIIVLAVAMQAETPKNIALIAGQRMEMECRTDSESKVLMWYYSPSVNVTPVTVVVNTKQGIVEISPNFSQIGIDVDQNGSGIIYSNSTKMSDAGIYICETEKGTSHFKHSAQLIVFESQPICETNSTGNSNWSGKEVIWMRCSVNFRGNWAPTMEWRQYGGDNKDGEGRLILKETQTEIISNSIITSTLTVLSSSLMNGTFYSCKTYFTWPNESLRTNATNIPEFSYTWNSSAFISSSVNALPTTEPIQPIDTTKADVDNIDNSSSKNSENEAFSGYMLIILGTVSILFFLLTVATVVVCCVIIRKRTAVLMANLISSYETSNSRQERAAKRSIEDCRKCQNDNASLKDLQLSEGYTSAENLHEEYSEPYDSQAGASGIPKYSAVAKKRPEVALPDEAYRAAQNDPQLYATLRKDIEPPKCLSIYASKDSDSDN